MDSRAGLFSLECLILAAPSPIMPVLCRKFYKLDSVDQDDDSDFEETLETCDKCDGMSGW